MTSIETIRDDFALLDEWEDRYRYVIELGERLPPFPDAARDERHRVQGCVSRVWLIADVGDGADPKIQLQGDLDAHIVRGLVAIMLALYSDRRASEIDAIDAEETLRSLGLDEHLTPQRANGLALDDQAHQTGSPGRYWSTSGTGRSDLRNRSACSLPRPSAMRRPIPARLRLIVAAERANAVFSTIFALRAGHCRSASTVSMPFRKQHMSIRIPASSGPTASIACSTR